MASAINVGSLNLPKMMRHIKHRTSQVRDLVFVRDPVYRKETKTVGTTTGTEGSGSTLAGPPVNFGYETSSYAQQDAGVDLAYHVDSPEIILPGLKMLQSPITSRSGALERSGHRITGGCTFYAPSLDYIRLLDNFTDTKAFSELESYDKLIDIERIIYNPSDSAVNDNTNSGDMWDDAWDLFTGQTLKGYEMDRLQFKLRRTKTNEATSSWNGILVDKIDDIRIFDDSDAVITLEPTSNALAPRIGPNNTWNTFDIPIRDLTVGDKLSYYINGYRLEFNVTAVGFDLDKMEGDTNTVKQVQIRFEDKVNLEFRDVYLYKEAEWRIQAIKEYRDEYMQISAVRVRGDRASRRRTYG
jgi:hypothetical protein